MDKFVSFLKNYRRYWITALLCLGLIISAVVEKNIVTKHYATLSLALALSVYWVIETIIMYVMFRKTYPQLYKLFVAETINSKNVSSEEIKGNHKKYYRQFKMTMTRDSWIGISYICLAIGVMIAFIVAMAI